MITTARWMVVTNVTAACRLTRVSEEEEEGEGEGEEEENLPDKSSPSICVPPAFHLFPLQPSLLQPAAPAPFLPPLSLPSSLLPPPWQGRLQRSPPLPWSGWLQRQRASRETRREEASARTDFSVRGPAEAGSRSCAPELTCPLAELWRAEPPQAAWESVVEMMVGEKCLGGEGEREREGRRGRG